MSVPTSPADMAVALVKQIRIEREAKGISKGELAKRAGVSVRAQSRYLGDNPSENRDIKLSQLIRYAEALGMDLDTLWQRARKRLEEEPGIET